MKVNPKLYDVANDVTPFETQLIDTDKEEGLNRKVELYLMDQFEGIKEEFVMKKGQFAVWSSADNINYRLFLENGYYDRVSPLYSKEVNKIWLDFYDKTDAISRKFSNYFVYPVMGVAIAACIASIFLSKYIQPYGSWIIIGVLALLFIAMIFVNMKIKKVVLNENTKARQLIVDHFGGNKFDELIELQKSYMDEYYENLYPKDEEENASNEDNKEAEALPEVKEEAKEATEEVKADEAEIKEDNVTEVKESTEVVDNTNDEKSE